MLTSAEIARVVGGHELTSGEFPPAGGHAVIESYCDGRVSISGLRGPAAGTYRIEGDALCITHSGANETTCSRIFQDRQGAYSRQWLPPHATASPTPISIRPATCEEATSSIYGRWQLAEINGQRAVQPPSLVLNPDGRMWGGALCNGFVGQFEHRGGALVFIDNEMTLLGCQLPRRVHAQHSAFLRMLVGTVTVRHAEPDTLILGADDGRRMILSREPEASVP